MKKTLIILYSIFVSLVLIFSISFFAVNIYNEKEHGSLRTEVRFEKIVTTVFSACGKANITSKELERQIDNAVGDKKDFSYIRIVKDSQIIYLFPSDYTQEMTNDSSSLVKQYERKNQNVSISAGLYTLRPYSIFYYAKISFYIILIVALLTIILILVTRKSNENSRPASIKKFKTKKIKSETIDASEDFDETDNSDSTDESDDFVEYDETLETESNDTLETEAVEIKKEELPVKDYEPMELAGAEETGLFSPDTGLGWESYLLTRLDNELNRATASELDLALFIFKFNGISRQSEEMKKICDYLISEFQFKDLIFEYKQDSVCALKISMDIDSAIPFAEKIVEHIKTLTNNPDTEVLAGITTRSIRMVTGERLLKEADEAVIHAAGEPKCKVVGFRADAIKYRKFLETK